MTGVVRLAAVTFAAALAVGLVVASSALAANPLFTPASGQALSGEGGAFSLSGAGVTITCTSSHVISANISSSLLVGGVVLHYLGCEYSKGEAESGCPVHSTNTTAEGLVLTNTLHGILGLLLPGNEVGIVYLPEVGTSFVTLSAAEKNGKSCGLETRISGDGAASIEPVGKLQKASTVKSTKKEVQEVDLTHGLGLIKAKIIAFGGEVALATGTESGEYSVATEVT
jgi:hypothetical protein